MLETTFESSMKELEEVVKELEKGELSLDEALSKFEKGINLSKECNKHLDEAEKKINAVVKNEDGSISEENFVPED